MKITVERFTSDAETTLSTVFVDGKFACFGLEDEYRTEKVAGETRIPAGTYKVGLRNVGGMTARYADRYPDIHRGMLHILDVPNFQWIYVHVGNRDEHTAGCLLVGTGAMARQSAMSVQASVEAYKAFYSRVADAAESGTLEIEIMDRDREDD